MSEGSGNRGQTFKSVTARYLAGKGAGYVNAKTGSAMQHSPKLRIVNRPCTGNEQARQPDKWLQLATPLLRVLTDCASAYGKHNTGEKGGAK